MALGLLEEQVQARIVHYKADLETNPELDAITAQVVAQLKEMQASSAAASGRAADRAIDPRLARALLRGLLERVFRPDAPSLLVEKRLKEIHRKLARLFFQSELHEKTRGKDGAAKVIQHGEQAIFYLLAATRTASRPSSAASTTPPTRSRSAAFDLLARFAKEMQDAFLSRRIERAEAHRRASSTACCSTSSASSSRPASAELAREVIAAVGDASRARRSRTRSPPTRSRASAPRSSAG